MAPVSAAERQRKRRENLKQLGLYEEHQARNREHNKKYRENLKTKFEKMKQEHKAILTDQKRIQERQERETNQLKRERRSQHLPKTLDTQHDRVLHEQQTK